jgi:hypothetical protein
LTLRQRSRSKGTHASQCELESLVGLDFAMALPPPTARERQTITLYTALMEEVKIRIATTNTLVSGKTGLLGPLAQESCYLQFRFMCELIALGCLVAHGDIDATRANKFRKEYSADKILHHLEDLHPDYFPFPSTITAKPSGVSEIFLHKEGNFLKKNELIDLYGKCGDHLHLGNLKKLELLRLADAFRSRFWVRDHHCRRRHWRGKIGDSVRAAICFRLSAPFLPLSCSTYSRLIV